ncbi:ubiquitin specific protease 40, isoform CRA_h, partial [Sigmodon hispidus]
MPIWWYQPAWLSGHLTCKSYDHSICSSSQDSSWRAFPTKGAPGPAPVDISFLYLGDGEISQESTLVELKSKVMDLPCVSKLTVLAIALHTVWTVESKHPQQ